MVFRALNRRRLVALGLGLLSTSVPFRIWNSDRKQKAVVDVNIRFPEGYTLDQYEYDVPIWARNDELRQFVRAYMRSGRLVDYQKVAHSSGVDYRFVFRADEDLKTFVRDVRGQGLVDFESRSSRGLVAVMRINGVEFEC